MGIKISFAVAYNFNQLIYAVYSLTLPCPAPYILAFPLPALPRPVKKSFPVHPCIVTSERNDKSTWVGPHLINAFNKNAPSPPIYKETIVRMYA